MNRRKTDKPPQIGFFSRFLIGYCLFCAVIAFGMFWYTKSDAQEMPVPQIVESKCLDGIVVIADGHVIGCVNGTQPAENINWTP